MFPLDGTPEQGAERITWQNLTNIFPAQYRSVQRAILTVAGKQFTCDGVLEVSTNAGWHLAIVSNLGLVAGLRVNRDGSCEVSRQRPCSAKPGPGNSWRGTCAGCSFRRRSLFPPGDWLTAGWFAKPCRIPMGRWRARLQRQRPAMAGTERVARGRRVYHAVLRGYRAFAGTARDVPAEIEVQAEELPASSAIGGT